MTKEVNMDRGWKGKFCQWFMMFEQDELMMIVLILC